MKIISSFNDYYDIGLSYGIDPLLIYLREEEEYNFKNLNESNPNYIIDFVKNFPISNIIKSEIGNFSYQNRTRTYSYIYFGVLLFCGKCYGYITNDNKTKYFYKNEIEDAQKYFKEYYGNDVFTTVPYFRSKKGETIKDRFIERFKKVENLQDNLDKYHINFKSPIISILGNSKYSRYSTRYLEEYLFTKNPILKNMEFYKILDPYLCFQELSMYLSGILSINSKPIIEINDTIKLEKHGFDKIKSFRKKK